ncbi:DUF3095 family protein [Wenyingzhuangia sp. IMCC45574]
MNDSKYYSKLSKTQLTLVDLLNSEANFSEVPNTWHVVVVDVKNSTKAVDNGKHHQINLTATGAIISVLNTIRKEKQQIEIPYFFGGDGATFILPESLLKKIIVTLNNYSAHVKKKTNLILRVGHISVAILKNKNTFLKIAKHSLTKELVIPIVLGNSLKIAEGIIKNTFIENNFQTVKKELINLEGMECRWKEIQPTQNQKKVVCLLIDCKDEKSQRLIYQNILNQMDVFFGDIHKRQPIKTKNLNLDFSISKIWKEMRIRNANTSFLYLIKNWLVTQLGRFYFNFSDDGKHYLKQIGQLSHTLMLDGMINTVFTGKQDKINTFIEYLDKLEREHKIIYGIHVTHAAVMSCYVLDRKTKHSHFVDGTEGGYTSAAKMFKAKYQKIK